MSERRSRGATPEAPEPLTSPPPNADGATTRAEYAQIEQVAARTGLTKRALRYYEEIGLLDPPTRTEGGYRLYSERDIARLESIKKWRELLGFSLAEIRELVSFEEEREQTRAEWSREHDTRSRLVLLDHSDELSRRTLSVVEEKIVGLEEIRAELRQRLERHERLRAELQAQLESEASISADGPVANGHETPDGR